jgi:hypothetical protein
MWETTILCQNIPGNRYNHEPVGAQVAHAVTTSADGQRNVPVAGARMAGGKAGLDCRKEEASGAVLAGRASPWNHPGGQHKHGKTCLSLKGRVCNEHTRRVELGVIVCAEYSYDRIRP